MSIFSKKDYICKSCGQAFQARFAPIDSLCKDCFNKREDEKEELQKHILGYVEYREKYDIDLPEYTPDEMRKIREYRDSILEKYRITTNSISRTELEAASINFKLLSQEEAVDVLRKTLNIMLEQTVGAVYTKDFFMPTNYDGTIVESKNIFAICYCRDYHIEGKSDEEILQCGVFTNDLYIPTFSFVLIGKMGEHDFLKSKKGREHISEKYTKLCPNLTYPICDVKDLEKIIKSETNIKGNINKEDMLNRLFELSVGSGIYNTRKLFSDTLPVTTAMLEHAGYMTESDVNKILHMEYDVNNQYWNKVMPLIDG